MDGSGTVRQETAFWTRVRRHLLRYGGEFVDFVPVRAEGAFLYDAQGRVVYGKRAVNTWGLVQAGLRAQHEPLSRPQMGRLLLPSPPHAGLLTQWASRG
jgi:hypothetical protein